MADAYIFDAVRTPRGKGKKDGSLYTTKPVDLLVTLLKALQRRNSFDTAQIDDVISGCVTQIGEQGANPARIAALYAGWDVTVPGVTLNRWCASGLEAINLAAMKVMSGMDDLIVAGGLESMSRLPMASDGGAWFNDPAVNDALSFIPQGISADLIASMEGFSREDVDRFAVSSHKKAADARKAGKFKSLIPVKDLNGITLLDHDETIRENTTLEVLAGLKPSFKMPGEMGFDATALRQYPHVERINHVHHAGNSSGLVDGAALALVGSLEKGKELGLKPRGKIRGLAVVGTEPTIMLTGPIPSTRKALEKGGVKISDIELFEINEAFASVVMKTMKELEIDPDKVNVNGGAIAMGHPLGATGAVLVSILMDEMEERDRGLGLCTLCVGGGMGIATVIERV
jgi:acetyl-CoA C-acetyltransferase